MRWKNSKYNLEEVRSEIINASLVVASIFGSITYLVSLTRLLTRDFNFSFLVELIVILTTVAITLNRKKLSNHFKSYAVILLLFLFVISDTIGFGLFSTSKVYLVLIPFFSLLFFSMRRSIVMFALAVISVLSIGFLHHIGILTIPESFRTTSYITRFYPWIINTLHVATVALVVLLISQKFLTTYFGFIFDLEEKNLAISERERNYHEIFDSTNESIFIYHAATGKIIDVNRAMLVTYGFTNKEDVLKLSIEDISSNEPDYSSDKAIALIKRTVKEGPQLFEWKSKKKDGKVFWSEVSLRCARIGGIERVLAVIRDITERKKAEEAIIESEKKFRDLADLLPQVLLEADMQGRVTFLNQHGRDLFGYNEEDLEKGIDVFSGILPEQRQRARENLYKKLSGQVLNAKDQDYLLVKKDGELFPAKIIASIILENGKPAGLRGMAFDLTDIKNTEREIRDSEEKYRTLMENLNDVIMLVDNDDRVKFVNRKFTEKFGYSEEEIIGRIGYEVLLDPEDQHIIVKENLDRTEDKTNQYEISFKTKKGDKVDFLVSGAPMKDSNGKTIGSLGAMIDITDRKRIERELDKYRYHLEQLVKERTEELESTNEELMAANEELRSQREDLELAIDNLQKAQEQLLQSEKMASLGILAAGVAHEINNPLNFIAGGIMGIENYFQDHFQDHFEEIKPLIKGINEGVNRAARIVASLNHYSRQDNYPKVKCDVNGIIDRCLVILQNLHKGRIEIKKEYTSENYTVEGNEGRLHQVFLNILTNAIQSINEKGAISIATQVQKKRFAVKISDTGIGIKSEDLPRITDPFYTTKPPGKGTGLGLSITQSILKEHKACMNFESLYGIGTTVTILLPLQQD